MEPVRFRPPLSKQRYDYVLSFVDTYKPKKVADLGCNECSLLHKLKFWKCIELLVGVDIDEDTLKLKKIEHLETDDLERMQDVLFGFMAPQRAIISTPNAEFNILLSNVPRFRHTDHKFEWSREEFQSWALKIASKYNYTVEFSGVGVPPPEHESVGFCSQIGVFNKNYVESEESISIKKQQKSVYNTVFHMVYPSIQDEKFLQKAVLNVALYHADMIKNSLLYSHFRKEGKGTAETDTEPHEEESTWPFGLQIEAKNENKDQEPFIQGDTVYIPLEAILAISKVKELCKSLNDLRSIIAGNVTLSSDGNAIIYPITLEDDYDNTDIH
ncbi:small RNA 2'-O-methyltransferase isoform X2 [Hyperolius riggenbachi]|uniref:small RNA 2'-O-methyltransferase isoform X2 n=1 Tax=Hyperolius riggenbachi TaxID=752182 RepID=UPI0035A36E26